MTDMPWYVYLVAGGLAVVAVAFEMKSDRQIEAKNRKKRSMAARGTLETIVAGVVSIGEMQRLYHEGTVYHTVDGVEVPVDVLESYAESITLAFPAPRSRILRRLGELLTGSDGGRRAEYNTFNIEKRGREWQAEYFSFEDLEVVGSQTGMAKGILTVEYLVREEIQAD